jgi:hypothetical protein
LVPEGVETKAAQVLCVEDPIHITGSGPLLALGFCHQCLGSRLNLGDGEGGGAFGLQLAIDPQDRRQAAGEMEVGGSSFDGPFQPG